MKPRLAAAAALVLFLLLCLGLDWRAGTFHSEFGRYSDEGMHYVTGLMIRDWVVSGKWFSPMRFAQEFYVHFPKVALGNWPPGFPLMQTGWTLVWGESRTSLLLLMMTFAALLATAVFRAGSAWYGTAIAAVSGGLLLAATLTQEHAAMVMAEIPLALFSFLAMAAFARYLEKGLARDALAFAAWTIAAILTKGNAWAIALAAPLALVLARSIGRLRRPHLWVAALLIALPAVPYTLFTMGIVSQGWNTRSFPGFAYVLLSLGIHARFAVEFLGIAPTVVALAGIWDRVLRPGKTAAPFWIAMAAYAVAIIVFHAMVPTSVEPRKIYQIAPVMCLFFGAGLDWIARFMQHSLKTYATGAAAFAGVLIFLPGFSLLTPYAPGFAPAVEELLHREDRRNAAVLISSNPLLDDSEAALIAEWASRERNAGTYLVRGTKLLSRPVNPGPDQVDYEPLYGSVEQVRECLAAIPISYIILHTTPAMRSYRHHDLLKRMLASYPHEWERIYASRRVVFARPHEIEIYRNRGNVYGVPVRLSVDLSNKIGRTLETGSPR
jgi:Dolichyl-phosphate-mannose-protein mannosyltransferase